MSGRDFGVFWGRGVSALWVGALLVAWVRGAAAQSTASFPEPPSAAPPLKAESAPLPAAKPPLPAESAPPSTASAPPSTASAPPSTASAPPSTAVLSTESALPLPPSVEGNLVPWILPYRDGTPIPPGYHVEHRSANGLIAGGLTTLIAAYGTAIVVGANDSFENGTGWLALPVIGPWAAIGARSYHCDNDPLKAQQCIRGAFSEVQTIAILSADAVVQATGAVLFLAGLGSGQDELVRDNLALSVRVVPRAVGASGYGVGIDGQF